MGSLLLTPQENESLFTFLGKKCVVSGRVPRRPRRRYLTGPGLRTGRWEWGRRRERRGEGLAAGQAYPGPGPQSARGPLPRCGQCGPRQPDAAFRSCLGVENVTSSGLSWSPA